MIDQYIRNILMEISQELSKIFNKIDSNIVKSESTDTTDFSLSVYIDKIHSTEFKFNIIKFKDSELKNISNIICHIEKKSMTSFGDVNQNIVRLFNYEFTIFDYSKIKEFFFNKIDILTEEVNLVKTYIPNNIIDLLEHSYLNMTDVLSTKYKDSFKVYISRYIFDESEHFIIIFQVLEGTCEVEIEFQADKVDDSIILKGNVSSDCEYFESCLSYSYLKMIPVIIDEEPVNTTILINYMDECKVLILRLLSKLVD